MRRSRVHAKRNPPTAWGSQRRRSGGGRSASAAGVTPRTFYRWRRQFGGLDVPAVRQMKELVSENLRLRGLVSNLFERLRTPADSAPGGAARR